MSIQELNNLLQEVGIDPVKNNSVTYELLFELVTNCDQENAGWLLRGLISRAPEFRKDMFDLYIKLNGDVSGVDIGWKAVFFPELKDQADKYLAEWRPKKLY